MKKLLAGILTAVLFLLTAAPALAKSSADAANRWKTIKATPGHPVTLEGNGTVGAAGKGQAHYKIVNGQVHFAGRGVVAVKGNPEIKTFGLGKKFQIGEWTYYAGYGRITMNGSDYSVYKWGRGRSFEQGEGKVTFRGWWKIRYHGGLNITDQQIESLTVPQELAVEAGSDAALE